MSTNVGPTPTPASTLRNRRRRAKKVSFKAQGQAQKVSYRATQRRVNKALSSAKRGMK